MSKLTLALLAAAATVMTSAPSTPARAEIEYPWCAQYGGEDGAGGRNCGFVSWEQCMETARGAGAWCEPNPFYKGPAERAVKPTPKRRDKRG